MLRVRSVQELHEVHEVDEAGYILFREVAYQEMRVRTSEIGALYLRGEAANCPAIGKGLPSVDLVALKKDPYTALIHITDVPVLMARFIRHRQGSAVPA